jgi:uncharacterized protein YegP (UPF0339 family)
MQLLLKKEKKEKNEPKELKQSPLRLGHRLLKITSATIDELAQLHLTTCARFANHNVDGIGGVLRARGFADFVDRQRRQYQALWSDRQDYVGSVAQIIRRAVLQANDLWNNPPHPSSSDPSIDPSRAPSMRSDRPDQPDPASPLAETAKARISCEPAFELFEDQAGGHRFRLVCARGSELLTSQAYKSQKGARNGIEVARRNASLEDRFERFETDSGLPMFNLKAGNHQVVGTSIPHQSSTEMEHALATVRTASANASIVEG